jgi:hypothetical protein
MPLANLIGGETLEQSEMHLFEFVDRNDWCRRGGYDARAFGRANERARKNAAERPSIPLRLERASRKSHLLAPRL